MDFLKKQISPEFYIHTARSCQSVEFRSETKLDGPGRDRARGADARNNSLDYSIVPMILDRVVERSGSRRFAGFARPQATAPLQQGRQSDL